MSVARILEAVEFAVKAHAGQVRKYVNEPYVAHPIRVAEVVSEILDEDAVIAALLHDTVEDCAVTLEQIADRFGYRVQIVVAELTDVPLLAGNRATRKALNNQRLANASSVAQTIKCVDIMDNTDSIVDNDPGFGKRFIEEVSTLLPLLTRADLHLLNEACLVVHAATMRIQVRRSAVINLEDQDVGC